MRRPLSLRLIAGLLALAVVAGVGLGSFYLVGAIDDTTPEQAVVASPTATAATLPTNTPEPVPTMASPSPTAEVALPTPTPEVATPRQVVPLTSGQFVEGGGTFQLGTLVFTLPPERTFRVGVSLSDPGGLLLCFLEDTATGSVLRLLPDSGREEGRYVTVSDINAVFDAIAASVRLAPERTPAATPSPDPTPVSLGERLPGGHEYQLGRLRFFLPDAGAFVIRVGIADPGGGFTSIYHVATDSVLFLDPDGGDEIGRRVLDPVANAIFDAIIASVRVVAD